MESLEPTRFGELLRQHRIAGGWTQEELAERAGVSVEAVKTLERGTRRSPRRDTAWRLADGLGLLGDSRSTFLAAGREGRASTPKAPAIHGVPVPLRKPPSGQHFRQILSRTPWPLRLLLVATLLALLTVAALTLPRGTRTPTSDTSLLHSRPIAVWGGPPSRLALRSPTGVAVDGAGDVYVADSGHDRIVELSPKGRFLAQWNGRGGRTFQSPIGVTVDSSGEIFVADSGNDLIQKLSPQGRSMAQWRGPHPDNPVQTYYHRPSSVAMGTNGIVFLTDPSWSWVVAIDQSDGHERYLFYTTSGPPGGIAGNSRGDFAVTIPSAGRVYLCSSYNGPGGPSLEQVCQGYGPGPFQDPEGIALDARDNMYIADRTRDRVVKLSPTGQFLSAWGSRGSGAGQFNAPTGVAVDSWGNIYVADTGNDRIQELSPSGAVRAQWGTGPTTLRLLGPTSIAIDRAGSTYLTANDRDPEIVKVAPNGAAVGRWRVPGALGGLAVGSDGFLYAVDSLNNQLVRISTTGRVLTRWGTTGSGSAELSDPSAIASDGHGRLYVADMGNTRIVSFSAGSRPFANWRQIVGPSAGLIQPTALTVDRHGDLYVADAANHRITAFSSQGALLREWSLPSPRAIAVDSGDRIYVDDAYSNHVLLFTPSGRLLESMGGRGSRPGDFRVPQGLAVDQSDNLYVADTGNDRIQVFQHPR